MEDNNGLVTAQPEQTPPPSGGTPAQDNSRMKLDFKRTLFVGFAFMGIMCFWEVYDYIMPLILNRVYGLDSTQYGLIMGLDNLLAIFLLPFFGHLSDKYTKAKYGRRTTFIFIGTLFAVVFMVVMILIENSQFEKVIAGGITDPQALIDGGYLDPEAWTEEIRSAWQQITDTGLAPDSLDSAAAIGLTGAGYEAYSDFLDVFFNAQYSMAWEVTKANPGIIAGFIVALLLVLVAMASYRSPAIALMPDVTPKPLRSQANALITLMGGAGGLASIILYTLLAKERYQSHIALFVTLAAVMAVMLIAYLFTVREKKFVQMLDTGIYHFVRGFVPVEAKLVATCLLREDIVGQEILTADKVSLRINCTCTYRITDYVKAITETDDYAAQLHTAFQLALREFVEEKRLDDLLACKDELSAHLLETLRKGFRQSDKVFNPIHFLVIAEPFEKGWIIFVIIDGNHRPHLVETVHQHAFRIEIRKSKRAGYIRHTSLPAPVRNGLQQCLQHFNVLDKVYPSETDLAHVPGFIGLMVYNGCHTPCHLPVLIGQEIVRLTKFKGMVLLPVKRSCIV